MPEDIELKCWPEPFSALIDGRKTFEWRQDDRPYRLGVTLHEREWEPCHRCQTGEPEECPDCGGQGGTYTGRDARFTVTYVMRERFGMPTGYVVMGIDRDMRPRVKRKEAANA